MEAKAHQHEAPGLGQFAEEASGSSTICERATRSFAVELFDDAAFKTAGRRAEQREDGISPELTASVQQHQEMESPAANKNRRRRKRQSPLTRSDGSNPYGRSPSSCNRHLRRRSRATPSTSDDNTPRALVDAEMEMGLAQGSRVAEKAMRAVKQANAQVCFANLEVRLKAQACLAPTGFRGNNTTRALIEATCKSGLLDATQMMQLL